MPEEEDTKEEAISEVDVQDTEAKDGSGTTENTPRVGHNWFTAMPVLKELKSRFF